MTRDEARSWYVQVLLKKVRDDPYPSATQLSLIEESLPRDMVSDYLQVLMDKVAEDSVPSIPMLKRIQRVAESLPQYERHGD